jgi:murein DD-endopeptidase MepM/ murein hydrolase activator NlpD
MRSSRFLLPFGLGAASVLVVLISAERAAPGVLGRVGNALQPGVPVPSAPAAGPESSGTGGPAPVPAVAPVPAGPPGEVPFGGGAPVEVPMPATSGGARLLIPVQGVAASSLVDTYEQARGQGRRHDAIDIMAPRGTAVLAVADGVVMKLFQSDRGGITLYELAPDRRTIYYYAHLDRYAAGMAEGKALHRGQVLGYVGNTGDAGPGNYHLHFEVSTTADPRKYWGGTPENPYPLLR